MTSTSTRPGNDPLANAIAASSLVSGRRPIPLVSTAYKIRIRGGLADVEAVRVFRNAEKASIEATLTFPMPVHAVVYGLEAKIGGRTLHAKARARRAARADYEDAIDRGKTAVLHEELMKGIHLLSVGHLGPSAEVVVTARFALALSAVGAQVFLRIPLTVGDVYGDPGLPDCDALTHGGPCQMGALEVACDSGVAVLTGGTLSGGKASIPLNAPLVVEIKGWTPRPLIGRTAARRRVKLSIDPAAEGDRTIDAALVVDHSGSMSEICAGEAGLSKHAAALLGLGDAGSKLRAGDRLHLFEFNDGVRDLGTAAADDWRDKLHELSPPSGGTEIGGALDAVRMRSRARDVLLVTDGKSHALDVLHLARSGKRFSVVLIGEDSLEANVAHLAALTGGDILIPEGARIAPAMIAMLGAIRDAGGSAGKGVRRAGMLIRVEAASADDGELSDIAKAVSAYAAGIRIASTDYDAAERLAETEGLLTHLTSFILVDEEGAAQTGLPATRKVDLPSPRGIRQMRAIGSAGMDVRANFSHGASRSVALSGFRNIRERREPRPAAAPPFDEECCDRMPAAAPAPTHAARSNRPAAAAPSAPAGTVDLSGLAGRIDWATNADLLAAGDVSFLDAAAQTLIRRASELATLRKLASRLHLKPLLLVIALLADAASKRDRHAARVARTILGSRAKSDLANAGEWIGLHVAAAGAPGP